MSVQNINQRIYPYNYCIQKPLQQNPIMQSYSQVPYQTSIYNSNIQYPYINFSTPITSANYSALAKIKSPNGEIVHLFQLKNGQKVAIMPRKDEATIVKTFLDAGSINETDTTRGISHCIEHCLFKGSSKLEDGDVFKLTSLMGASTNASTDYAQTDYYITAPYMDINNLAKTIEIQGDMISNPSFNSEAINSEKGPICSEISMICDDPTTTACDLAVRNLFQIDSNSLNLVAGSIETVQNLSRDDIVKHHDTYYDPNNLYTVVVGDVDVDKTIDLIANNFTIQPKNSLNKHTEKLTPIQTPVRVDLRSSKTNATNVLIATAGPKPLEAKEKVISQLFHLYLSSFSTSEFKKGLEDMSGAFDYLSQKVGLSENDPEAIITLISLNPKDEQRGLDLFYDSIQKLQNVPISDEDLNSLKINAKKNMELSLCDSTSICDLLGKSMLSKSYNMFSNYYDILNGITKEDIMNFARKYYDLNKISIVVVHPSSVSDSDIKLNYSKSKYAQNSYKSIAFTGNIGASTKNVKEYCLNNNTHIALNSTNSNICAFNWCVNTPPVKPKNPNIPAILRYMFHKGTNYKNQTELERFKELNGIDVNVDVSGRSIVINASCLPESADKTLNIMNELMYNPKFTQSDFEDAKRYVKDNLKNQKKNASKILLDKLYPGFFPTHKQMLKELDKLQLSDVIEFYNEKLASASSSFVATMPFNNNTQLENMVLQSQNQGNIVFQPKVQKFARMFKPDEQTSIIYDIDDLNQAQIYKSYKFPLSGNIEDEVKFEMLNTILGATPNSRLFTDLRSNQNLAYSVSSSVQSFENTGVLTLKIQTTTDNKEQNVQSFDNVQKSLEGFKKHTDLLQTELVSDEELEAAKMRLKQNITGECQNPLTETALLALNIQEPYGIKRIDKYVEAIDKITKEDIRNTAKFIFSHNSTTSILASQDTINSQLPYLRTQGVVSMAV